jgi:hypothetical protein
MLWYNPDELATIPVECTASFAGVGNPHRDRSGRGWRNDSGYWLGCRHGFAVGRQANRITGRAIRNRYDAAMIERAKCTALKTGVWQNVEIRRGTA